MKVTRAPLELDSKWWSVEHDVPRTAGIHLSAIIDEMEAAIDPKTKQRELDEADLENYRFGGFIFEHVAARSIVNHEVSRLPDTLIRPGEYFWCAKCDIVIWPTIVDGENVAVSHCRSFGHRGIFATPDAIFLPTYRLKEWKFTWKSSRRAGGDTDPDCEHVRLGIWRWPVQCMGYAFLVETLGSDLEAFFVNGDYSGRKQPRGYRFSFDFTPAEITKQWSAFASYGRRKGWL